jgi:hypothetical protein
MDLNTGGQTMLLAVFAVFATNYQPANFELHRNPRPPTLRRI